jgi:hypothetical protein
LDSYYSISRFTITPIELAGCPVTGENPDSLQIHGFRSTIVRLPGEKGWFTAALKDCSVTRREGLVHDSLVVTEQSLIAIKICSVTRRERPVHDTLIGKEGWADDDFEGCSVTRSEGCDEPDRESERASERAQARKVACSNPGSNHGTWAIFIHGGIVRDLRNEPVWHSANIAGDWRCNE